MGMIMKYTDEELRRVLEAHKRWLARAASGVYADLCGADLRGADLCGANMQAANLRGANLDYSCWPLWCGSLDVKVDKRIAAQLAYHFCRLDCDDPAYIQARNALVPLANTFHLVEECGRVEMQEVKSNHL